MRKEKMFNFMKPRMQVQTILKQLKIFTERRVSVIANKHWGGLMNNPATFDHSSMCDVGDSKYRRIFS